MEIRKDSIKTISDMKLAVQVMRRAAKWLLETGKKPSKWWQLKNLNADFLLQYAKPEEFYVALVDGNPAAAAVLQINQKGQDWSSIDRNKPKPALYIHWLCVDNKFSGMGLPKVMMNFAEKKAKENRVKHLRVDTNAKELKLEEIYEALGFYLVATEKEDYRETAFYEKEI